MAVKINPDARRAVYARSKGMCERCHKFIAVHVHHLTYERAGHESPDDLQHICVVCHMEAHPEKAQEILKWELRRIESRRPAEEADEEREREEIEPEEPAWNLGRYTANAYCLEDVEKEEGV